MTDGRASLREAPRGIRELTLATRLRDYVRGDLALTREGVRLLLLDAAAQLEVSGRNEIERGRRG